MSNSKLIRAYALVQILEQTFCDLSTLWGDGDSEEMDEMLQPNYPFNESFDDLWVRVRRWMDTMPNPHPEKAPEPKEEGVFYLFVDGKYINEYQSSDLAAVQAAHLMDVDIDMMRNSGEDWSTWLCDHTNKHSHEIIHESDYRFAQGNWHPKDAPPDWEQIPFPETLDAKDACVILSQADYNSLKDAAQYYIDSRKSDYNETDEENAPLQSVINTEPISWINGVTSFMETHHEVVAAITLSLEESPEGDNVAVRRYKEQGTGGMYELALELTYKFELMHALRQWDGEFFDEIESFMENELKVS